MGTTMYLLLQITPLCSPSLQTQLAGGGCSPNLKVLPVKDSSQFMSTGRVFGGDKGWYRRRELG